MQLTIGSVAIKIHLKLVPSVDSWIELFGVVSGLRINYRGNPTGSTLEALAILYGRTKRS